MIENFHTSDFLKIRYMSSPQERSSNRVLIWFSGIAGALGSKARPSGFFKSLNIDSIIWVDEKAPFSWGNSIDIEELCKTLLPLTKNKELLFFGNSMGGFLAILLSKYLKPIKVITMNPQYSVHPDIILEKRWPEFINVITQFKHKDLTNSFIPDTDYAIMFGVDDQDELHFRLFNTHRNLPNVQIIKFLDYKTNLDNAAHQAGVYLNRLGIFRDVIANFYNSKSLKEIFIKNSVRYTGLKH
jgi:hypothetical protein